MTKRPPAIIVSLLAFAAMFLLWLLACLATFGKMSLFGIVVIMIPIPIVLGLTVWGIVNAKKWARILALVQFALYFLFGGLSNIGRFLNGGGILHLVIGATVACLAGWLFLAFRKNGSTKTYFQPQQ